MVKITINLTNFNLDGEINAQEARLVKVENEQELNQLMETIKAEIKANLEGDSVLVEIQKTKDDVNFTPVARFVIQ